MNSSESVSSFHLTKENSGSLARRIFKAEIPAEIIRTLPIQSLYLALNHNGVDSSVELLEAASLEQTRLLMDFDLWSSDRLDEEKFWGWLRLPDQQSQLAILGKLMRSVDLKLPAILVGRYVESETFEEPTDQPPGPKYVTPDKGYTWVKIDTGNEDHDFLFGRFLAFLFDQDPDLYYQLLSIPGVATTAALEEEAYQERTKRLEAEGMPGEETAAELNTGISRQDAASVLNSSEEQPSVVEVSAVRPLVYDTQFLAPLAHLFLEYKNPEELEVELTWIMNCAIVHYNVDLGDSEGLRELAERVKGALNIGVEKALEKSGQNLLALYQRVRLKGFYRIGLAELHVARAAARKQLKELAEDADQALRETLERVAEQFPCLPAFVGPDGETLQQEGKLLTGRRAFNTLKDLCGFLNQ